MSVTTTDHGTYLNTCINEIESEILDLDLSIERAERDRASMMHILALKNQRFGLRWSLSVIKDGHRKHTVKTRRGRTS